MLTPAIDPTENVKALQEASNQRQDDLRKESRVYFNSEIEHVKEIAHLRADYTKQLAEAEAKRIDAIRAVDVNAVAVASERQAAAASVLATQVAQSADALRTLVAQTATAIAEQQRQSLTQITDRLTIVERTQYEGRGKSTLSDPMVTDLAADVRRMSTLLATGGGRDAAVKDYTGWIVAVIGTLFGLVGLVGTIVSIMRG